MWNDRYTAAGFSLLGRANFDPLTLTVMSLGATAAGGAMSAAGTLAGGSAAKQAGDLTAGIDRQNAAQAVASGQRKMLDTQDRTRMAMSTATARAGASGVDAGMGSPATDVGDIAKRGSYHALIDMFNGKSEAVGFQNQANEAEWEGKMKQDNSYLSAAGTLAGSAGSMFSTYGQYKYPNTFRPRRY